MRFAGILVALAAAAGAQTSSSSNGWSFAETLRSSTDVVVADIASGAGADDGAQVTVRATLRVVRVLAGGLAPGAEIPLTWQYKPLLVEGPAVTSKVPPVRGLWFLKKQADGGMAPLRASVMMSSLGGYYLPAGAAPRYYDAGMPLEFKIAREIAPIIEEIATQHAADLAPRPYAPAPPTTMPEWAQTRSRFQALVMVLENLDVKAKQEIYADFSARPDPYLKAIGVGGRLHSGDASALLDLEANLAAIGPIFDSGSLPPGGMAVEVRNNLPAARALARLAVGETAIAGIEGSAAMNLAWTRSPEFLPYFLVMLGSPLPWTRDSALMAFCPLLRDGPLWKAEMAEHCPNRSPVNDAAAEQADIRYWRTWWEANRGEIAKTVALPTVTPPGRYSVAPRPQMVEIPREIRFLSLLHMARNGPYDPVIQQLPEGDRAPYRATVAAVNARLDAIDQRAEQVMNAARIAGKMPELAQMTALNDDRNAALKSGLDDLRNRLTPAGWQAVETFLSTQGGIGAVAGPRPPQ